MEGACRKGADRTRSRRAGDEAIARARQSCRDALQEVLSAHDIDVVHVHGVGFRRVSPSTELPGVGDIASAGRVVPAARLAPCPPGHLAQLRIANAARGLPAKFKPD